MTLHERIRAELDRRTAVANAATPGPWSADPTGTVVADADLVDDPSGGEKVLRPIGQGPQEVAECYREERRGERAANASHIALHDPTDALRRYAGELEVLERHYPVGEVDPICAACSDLELGQCRIDDCPELKSLASRLGVSVDG
jgi:hypothetical protein